MMTFFMAWRLLESHLAAREFQVFNCSTRNCMSDEHDINAEIVRGAWLETHSFPQRQPPLQRQSTITDLIE
jgi:hypothetical protein